MPDPTKFNFSQVDAARIAKATRAYEAATLPDAPPSGPPVMPQFLWIRIDTPDDDTGVYNVRPLQSNRVDRTNGEVTAADFGTVYTPPDGIRYKALNALEISSPYEETHTVVNGTIWPAWILRRQSDGTIFVGFNGFRTIICENDGEGSAQ